MTLYANKTRGSIPSIKPSVHNLAYHCDWAAGIGGDYHVEGCQGARGVL